MTMREQMDAAWRGWRDRDETSSPEDRLGFELGFQAALALIRNPSDEMVERCAKGLALHEGYGPEQWDWMNKFYKQKKRDTARACLAAAVGGE